MVGVMAAGVGTLLEVCNTFSEQVHQQEEMVTTSKPVYHISGLGILWIISMAEEGHHHVQADAQMEYRIRASFLRISSTLLA